MTYDCKYLYNIFNIDMGTMCVEIMYMIKKLYFGGGRVFLSPFSSQILIQFNLHVNGFCVYFDKYILHKIENWL
jgi:hypothetical protein